MIERATLDWLASSEGRQALRLHANDDPNTLALAAHRHPHPERLRAIAEQLRLRQQQRSKFGPRVADLLLTAQAAEQAASWPLAHWRARTWGPAQGHQRVADLASGLGMDALAMATAGAHVSAVELNPTLAHLLELNARALKCDGLTVATADGLDWLSHHPDQDLVLCDPDRRASGQRSLDPQRWSPDPRLVAERCPQTQTCMIKCPPAQDATALRSQLAGDWQTVVVSLAAEAKELLLIRDPNANNTDQVSAIGLQPNGEEAFRFSAPPLPTTSPPCRWPLGPVLVDPDPAITCSGLVAPLLAEHALARIHPLVAYGHGADPGPAFPGTRLQVLDGGTWDTKAIKACLRRRGIERLRASRRHFPWQPAEILRRLRIREGGNLRLCCFRNADERLCWALGTAL